MSKSEHASYQANFFIPHPQIFDEDVEGVGTLTMSKWNDCSKSLFYQQRDSWRFYLFYFSDKTLYSTPTLRTWLQWLTCREQEIRKILTKNIKKRYSTKKKTKQKKTKQKKWNYQKKLKNPQQIKQKSQQKLKVWRHWWIYI